MAGLDWEKIETKLLPLATRQILSPGLYDRTLMNIVSFQPPPPPIVPPVAPGNKNPAMPAVPPIPVPPAPPALPLGPPPPPTLKLPRFGLDKNGKPRAPFVARFAQEFIWVDFDGDGKPGPGETQHIGADGYSDPFTCELFYEDGTTAKHAFRFKTIADKDQYALIRASARVFDFRGKRIMLLDDDGNGKYNDAGRDAVWVEGQPVCFLGKHIQIGDALFEIIVHQSGGTVEIRPAAKDLLLGSIEPFEKYVSTQRSENLKLHTLIFSGSEGSFACDETHRSVPAPAGTYDMVFALFERTNETVFLKKGAKTSFNVIPKAAAQPKWGGPVKAHFSLTSDGEEVTVGAPHFLGIGSEEYIPEYGHALPCTARVSMVFRDRAHLDIESYVSFASHKFETLPNGDFKPLAFKRYRNVSDEYEAAVEYTSGILGRVDGKERLAFTYKKKNPNR